MSAAESEPRRSTPLSAYKKKRDFAKTPEPKVQVKSSQGSPIFVVQEHHARRLHWDFRLEYNGVLKSWAVTKEPPLEAGIKRLAVQTEDHPLDYGTFEGTIQEGEYGAGTVKIWDTGTFETESRTAEKIVVNLKGKKLKGGYVLVKLRPGVDEKNWLFFKKKG